MSQLSRSQPIQPEDDRSLSTPRRSGRVLVLGTDQRVILAVARSLGRQGLAVELGWCAPQAPATRSRYVVRTHTIPAYARDDDRWKCVLLDLLDRETYDLVIPCNDSTLVPLIAHRSDFDRFPEIYVLPDNVFSIVSDKFKTYELAVAQSVNVPRGFVVDATADPSRLIDVLGLPIVLKPQSTFTVRNRDLANVVCKARDRDELRSQLERLGLTPCLAQQNFGGRGVGVEMLVRQGEILFAFQHERLHESMEWGSSYRRSVAVQPELLDASRRMMRAIGYTGVAMAEYMVDPDSGRWVFLEINGRFWGPCRWLLPPARIFPGFSTRCSWKVDAISIRPIAWACAAAICLWTWTGSSERMRGTAGADWGCRSDLRCSWSPPQLTSTIGIPSASMIQARSGANCARS
jgi:predicted ATP-grasp superfamily ATP-dependent carboligase